MNDENQPDTYDKYDLNRFVRAQKDVYEQSLSELKNGNKQTHWMWFIFPQIAGLGFSSMTKFYSIKSLDEARAFLAHPVLGKRLMECAQAVLAVENRSVSEVFGSPDDLKFKSSLTLFASVAEKGNRIFIDLLSKYFDDKQDSKTLKLLEELENNTSQ